MTDVKLDKQNNDSDVNKRNDHHVYGRGIYLDGNALLLFKS